MSEDLTRQERRALDRASGALGGQSKGGNKVWLWMVGIILIVILAAVGLAFVGRGGNKPVVTGDLAPISEKDNRWGEATAPVTIIEYSDFQCPACQAYSEVVNELKQELAGKFVLAYRHYPLPYHQNAEIAAKAAEAAARQNKFWEMHDKLFATQDNWSEATNARQVFVGYAAGLGLDPIQFESDLDSQAVADKIKSDQENALAIGVPGTPTFFVNGKMIDNPKNKDAFVDIITKATTSNVPPIQAQ